MYSFHGAVSCAGEADPNADSVVLDVLESLVVAAQYSAASMTAS